MSMPDRNAPAALTGTVLELTVNNHPGVMSHICGLFARRAFNVEGVACLPLPGGEDPSGGLSRVWLLLREDERLGQIVSQVEKLHDVRETRVLAQGHPVFAALAGHLR
ncbi:acetolactate synthase 1 regulatory subunit [Alkalidesulfovibrio alkalitolerans DSM 16529]|jgi:acetolactate synthase-1/3 small subunit|uniref:Acetolactate synthase 1 regulatory subunit n=1 Tax=Alkalidesulfovibrio alkalitolerans DSM 16529 TaxID=1121439 RepID=S7UL58_9BACT|nr:ACT domain-containing protein [Alkalidesulfovibrio alkalitolerans]EPR33068.1 acetolactate synthase 1 regulatory subunit [Alkalidesulfovibrio alkalitolerans DSM 16529]